MLGLYLTIALIVSMLLQHAASGIWWQRFFRSNMDLFEAVGVGTKTGIQRYDLDDLREEDVAEGLADLCGDVIRSYVDLVTFTKFVSTQLLILAGTIVGAARTSKDEQVVLLLM